MNQITVFQCKNITIGNLELKQTEPVRIFTRFFLEFSFYFTNRDISNIHLTRLRAYSYTNDSVRQFLSTPVV